MTGHHTVWEVLLVLKLVSKYLLEVLLYSGLHKPGEPQSEMGKIKIKTVYFYKIDNNKLKL